LLDASVESNVVVVVVVGVGNDDDDDGDDDDVFFQYLLCSEPVRQTGAPWITIAT
jgi:uncharacterized protein YciU (UPF0263 family)